MKKLVLCLSLFLAGCGTLQDTYVTADRKDYDVWKPLIEEWLVQEPGNVIPADMEDAQQYVDFLWLKLKSRGLRIAEAEALLEKGDE